MLQMQDQSLPQAGKTVLGQDDGGDYRKPSRFTDVPPGREMPDKRPGGFPDAPPPPPRPSGSADNRSSFQGYGQPPNPTSLMQSGVGDFRGLQDKMQSLYPGSQSSGGESGPALSPSFAQPPPGGMAYARPPPPPPVTSAPPTAFGAGGPHWAGAAPLSASNGRQDWRPGFGGPSGQMQDYQNPMHQQRLSGNWQPDAMAFSRFH